MCVVDMPKVKAADDDMVEIAVPETVPEVDEDEVVNDAFSGLTVEEVNLEFFVGKTFKLTGVGAESVKVGRDEDATHFSVILNNQCYTVMEDPSDGYRSSMREIWVTKGASIKNRFPACEVTGRKCTDEHDDTVELVDTTTGKVVIEFGTSNTDDYYPCFVGNFQPENMLVNEPLEDRMQRELLEAQAAMPALVETQSWGSW